MSTKNRWAQWFLFGCIAVSTVGLAFTVGYVRGAAVERENGGYAIQREVQALITQYYIADLPTPKQFEYGAVRGLLNALGDPYTVFLEPPLQELESQSLSGEFGGIGVNLRRDEAGNLIMTPFEDYPAIRAGIRDGDALVAVDGVAVTAEMSLDEISALVRGPIGTTVRITFRRGAEAPREVTLTREKIELPSVTSRVLDQDSALGLIAISRFSEKTPDETRRAIEALQAAGVTGLVIDLRGNGGGLLDSAIGTAGHFLDGGVIMYENRRDETEKVYEAPPGGIAADMPLVVLVNHATASASEILAGALRDRGRGPLIGQTTFGKGSVQLVFELSDRSSVHITNARWYTPTRLPIDGVGLKPDIELQPGADGADPELARAVEYLQNLTHGR